VSSIIFRHVFINDTQKPLEVTLDKKTSNIKSSSTTSPTISSVSQAEVSSDLYAEISKQEIAANKIRLDEILNDCSKSDIVEQYPIVDSTLKKITENFKTSEKLNNRVDGIIMTGKVEDVNRTALFNYVRDKPTDKIAYKLALSECAKNSNLSQCNDNLFEQAYLVDKNNGALSFDIASILLKQGNERAALIALENAGKSQYFSNYYYEFIKRVLNIILDHSSLSHAQSITAAIGLGAALPYELSSVFTFCKNNNGTNYLLSDACGKVGELIEKQSDTIILKNIGLQLQKNYFKEMNNQKAIDQLQIRTQAFEQEYKVLFEFKGSELIAFDEKLARLWLNTGINLGEASSFNAVNKEVKLLLQNPVYNPCKSQTH